MSIEKNTGGVADGAETSQLQQRKRLGRALQARREALLLTQQQLAERVGASHKQSIVAAEGGTTGLSFERLQAFAEALETTASEILWVAEALPDDERFFEDEEGLPGWIYLARASHRVREVARSYLRVMHAAQCSAEQIEAAARLMIDSTYSKLHVRDQKERSEEDLIVDMERAWEWIRESLVKDGVRI